MTMTEFISNTAKLELLTKASRGAKVCMRPSAKALQLLTGRPLQVAAVVVTLTTIVIIAVKMGNRLCGCGRDTSEEVDPVPQLYAEGAAAWMRYLDEGHKPSDLAETIEKSNEALDAAQDDHPQRNDILLMLSFAMLEQNLDQASLETIEKHFSELEGWKDLGKADACAIAARLASGYHESYNQAPSDSDFERCLSSYTRVRKYSDKLEDRTEANLKIAALHQQRGQFEAAMGVIDNAKSTCPPDRPNLLSAISMAKFALYQDMYKSTGSSEELEKAIAEGEDALQIQSDMLPARRAALLTGVAQFICALSEAQPPEVDFEGRMRDAIRYARESVGLNAGEQGIEATIVLANALSSRRIEPTTEELDEAIGLYRKAKEGLGSDQELLASLAGAIGFRCERGGEVVSAGTTFQSAVKLYEEALATSTDNRWNSSIANNIAWIYVEKANRTKNEADYEKARDNYLKAASYLEEVGSDLGDTNDVGYFRDQAEAVTGTITTLKQGSVAVGRKLTPKRLSTAEGRLR
jgi:tetratricopeptide (TPR) repeat protein